MNCYTSYNPATGEPLGAFPILSAADVDCAVESAAERFSGWRALSVRERCARLRRLHDRLANDADALAALLNREIGKPLQDAYAADVLSTLSALAWLTRQAPRVLRRRALPGAACTAEPYGVVGVIGTWNYPLFLDLTTIAWALAAGNTVVWKPSELATISATALHAHCEQAGLPVCLVTGDGATGRALCRAGCDKIAFTGGITTGRAILAELAATGTPSVMELSGNDAMLVCADADVALAARAAVWARCCNAGQSCVAPQRFYVAITLYDRFLQECRTVIETLRPGIDYGPLRTEGIRRGVQKLVWEAVGQGARLLAGGRCLEDLPGTHYAPTLLADCRDEMRVMSHDFFGPVLAVSPVNNEEEAIARANASYLALGASVWTRDRRRGRQIAERLQVGTVAVNTEMLLIAGDARLPFGGLGASGFGKQRGAAGLEEFVQWKVVTVRGTGGARRHLFPYCPATLPIMRGLIALRVAHGLAAKTRALRQLMQAAKDWK